MNLAVTNNEILTEKQSRHYHIKAEMLACSGNYIIFSNDIQEYRPTAELMKQSGYQLVELYYEDFRNCFENEFYSICPEMEIYTAICAKCGSLIKADSKCVILVSKNRRIRMEQEQLFWNTVLKTLLTDIIGLSEDGRFPVLTNLVLDNIPFRICDLKEHFAKAEKRNMRIILNTAGEVVFLDKSVIAGSKK